jgi:hypothetical protein
MQRLVRVPQELIQLQQKVQIVIDVFFVNGHTFFMTYSRMICYQCYSPHHSQGG